MISPVAFFRKRLSIYLLAFWALFWAGQSWAGLGASVTLSSGSSTSIYPGQTTTLEISLSNNNGQSAINNVAFSNNLSLPVSLSDGLFVSGPATYTCHDPLTSSNVAGSGTLTADLGTQAISLVNGVIPARANNTDGACTIQIPVTAKTSTGDEATYTYTINDGAVTGDDGSAVANVGAVSQSINVRELDRPAITKSFASSTVTLGGDGTRLTITLSNSNPVAITGFNITDSFPVVAGTSIIEVASPPNAAVSCNNGGADPAFSPVAGATSLSATGTIPAAVGGTNGQCTISVDVEGVTTNGNYSVGRDNVIDRNTDFSTDVGIPAQSNATARVNVRSPLDVRKNFAHSSLSHGESDSLTIRLFNNGDSNLTVSTFEDSPIDGVDTNNTNGLLVTSQSTTCNGGTVAAIDNNTGIRLTGGVIPARSFCTVTVNFTGTVATPGVPITYTNTIAAGAVDVGDADIVSRGRTASVLVADNLRVSKSVRPARAAPGNPVEYTVTVRNYTNAAISDLAINDTLPAGLTFLNGNIGGNNFTPQINGAGCSGVTANSAVGASTANLVIGTVPARASINSPAVCNVVFWAMTNVNGGVIAANTLEAGDVCYNNGTSCNGAPASSTNNPVETAFASATKRFNGSTAVELSEGTIATLTFVLTNNTANPLTNVSLSDTFPVDSQGGSGQLQIASPANASTTCGSPTITAVPGANSIAMNGATVPARGDNGSGSAGSCTLSVDVIGPAGEYPNTARVAAAQTLADGTSQPSAEFDTDQATLTYKGSLSASKEFTPNAASAGGVSTVRVTLNNSGAVQLTNLSFTDNLPAGMTLANPVNAHTTCAGATGFTSATPGSGIVGFNGATVPGNGTCDVLFNVTVTGNSNWTNTLQAGDITADGGIINTTPVSAVLTNIASSGNITVAKTSAPSILTFPGQISQLTVTVTNGASAVSNLSLVDHFTVDGQAGSAANGMIIATPPALTTDCPSGVVSGQAGGAFLKLEGVSLSAGQSCTFSANVTSTSIGGVTNYIPVNAVSTDQGLTNNAQASTSLTAQSNIGVVKAFTPSVIKPGERSRLKVTLYNATPLGMSNIAFTDNLPANVTVPAGPNPVTTCVGGSVTSTASTVSLSDGSLSAAVGNTPATCYLEIDVTSSTGGAYTNTIATGGVTASSGGTTVTNSQPTSDTLRVQEPLLTHVAFNNLTQDSGNPASFTTGTANSVVDGVVPMTIYIENPNAEPVSGMSLTDYLPNGLSIAQTPNASTTCSGGVLTAPAVGDSVRLTGATLNANSSCTITVNVLSRVPGTYINDIPGSAINTNEGVSNEEQTTAKLIVATPPSVRKEFSPSVIPSGGTSRLTIRFVNDNASSITLTSAFTDNLPAAPGAMLVAGTPNLSKTCPGNVTAAAGASSVTYVNGSVIPAGGCSISVDVTATATGEHINNIPAGDLQTDAGNNLTPTNSSLFVSELGYISGRVFLDNDVTPDGVYTAGTDTPIAGTQVSLVSGGDCTGALVSIAGVTNPASTDASGRYLFGQLPAGTYSVCQTGQPSGSLNGSTTAGSIVANNGSTGTAGSASNPTATTSQITSIVINNDGGSLEVSGSAGNDFAEVTPSTISGQVFIDRNNNGDKNGTADTGLSGQTIELLDSANSVVATTTTDSDGNYSFTNLAPGTYSVRQPNQPANTANGLTTAGSVGNGGTSGTASTPTTQPSVISSIVLPPNTVAGNNNFAEMPKNGRVSGRVFIDFDNNGSANGSDHGIGGQTINLTGVDDNGNPVNAATTTDSDGNYTFTGLPTGTYTLTQPNQPPGTTNGITTPGSGGGTATNAATTPSSITGITLSAANPVAGDNLFAETASGVVDLTVDLSHTPSTLGEGSTNGSYTVKPSNIGNADSSGVVTIVTNIPPGITPTRVRSDGDWNCTIAGQVVTCTSSTVIPAGGAGEDIHIDVFVGTGLSGNVLIADTAISGGNEPSSMTGNNTDTDPASISQAAQSSIGAVKSFTPRAIKAGERSRLRVTLYNATQSGMTNIAFTDTLPANMTVPAGPNPVTTCVGGSVTSTANTVSLSGGSLAAAAGNTPATCYLEIDVTSSTGGDHTNTIPAGGVTAESGGSTVTNSQPTSDTVRVQAPLPIHVAFNNLTQDSGNPATFTTGTASGVVGGAVPMTIYIENPNAESVSGLNLTDHLPSNLLIAPIPNASTTCNGGVLNAPAMGASVQLTGATLNASSSCTITVNVLSNVPGTYTNDIPSAAINTNEGVSNGEQTTARLIIATPPSVLKEFSPSSILSGGTSRLTIRLVNENASAITLTSAFTDSLPAAPGAMLVAGTPNLSKTCPGNVTAAAGSSSVTYANGSTIPVGGCSISVDVTASASGEYINNIPAGDLQTDAGNNQTPTNSSLFVSGLGYISGRVFLDNDVTPDGVYTAGTDTPVVSTQVSLVSGGDCTGALATIAGVTNPASTDASGRYLFGQLPAGTYSVCQTSQPSGTLNGSTTAGSIVASNGSTGTAGSASNPTATTSQITSIVINNDGGSLEVSGSTENNFAEITPSTISGQVFVDSNNNGENNGADDTGIAGQTIELLDSGNNVIATATTDSDGNYSFTNLAPGTYSVRQPNQPANTANGLTTAGSVGNGGTSGTASAPTTQPSVISSIVLPPNTVAGNNNFAEMPENGRVSGRVFIDFNNNGSVDGSDHGIGGQTINLTGVDENGNPVSAETTTTDSDGNYTFTGLPAGTYTLTQPNQPSETTNGITTPGSGGGTATGVATTPSSITGITLSAANPVAGNNLFAETAPGIVDLAVDLSHTPSTLGEGSTGGSYTVKPSNVGNADSSGVVTIVTNIPPGITPTGVRTDGDWNCTIAGQVVTCTSSTAIPAGGAGADIHIDVSVANGLAGNTLVANTAISGGNEPSSMTGNNTDTDPTPISQSATVSGHVWRDADHDKVRDPGEENIEGWVVLLKRNGVTLKTTTTGSDGSYSFTNLSPSSGYEIEFREPVSGRNLGRPVPNESNSGYTSGVENSSSNPTGAVTTGFTLSSMTLSAGDNITEQSLPIDPSGVVYNAVTRQPVAGAQVTLNGPAGFDPNLHLLGGSANQTQTTDANGWYQFLLNAAAPAGEYTLSVVSPTGYIQGASSIIPACTNVPAVAVAPDPALVQNNNAAPALSAASHAAGSCPATSAGFAGGANTTQYYFGFNLNPGLPSANVLNNHIPLDPILEGALAVTKTAAKDNISQGELIPYTITATNRRTVALPNVTITDQAPPGFKYVANSARIDSVPSEPVISGRTLTWNNVSFAAGATRTINLLLLPGTGVGEGEYVNQAWASLSGYRISNIATATVRLVPDPTFDCSDIIGKVFDDQNRNGYQDEGEPGLPGVRVATVNGELITTDKHGRYHVTCAATPDELKGSNFILKLDTNTLPSGYRVTTENPRVVRMTRGKIAKLNFGAGIHRVIRLDVDDSIWQDDELSAAYANGITQLLEILKEQPSVLRIGYQRDSDVAVGDAQSRAEKLAGLIEALWQEDDEEERDSNLSEDESPEYDLAIEIEIIEPSLTVEAKQ